MSRSNAEANARTGASRRPAPALSELAPAKLNLTLEVVGRRADGYHALTSLIIFAEIGDRLSFTPAAQLGPAGAAVGGPDFTLSAQGPFAGAIDTENLILRAARAYADRYPDTPGGHFHLEKVLPVAAGLGGGSADAAAAVRLLAQAQGNREALGDSIPWLARLGADIPVCLSSRPAWVSGIGEHVAALAPLPAFSLVLANPGVRLSTAAVFAALSAQPLASQSGKADEAAPPPFTDLAALITYLTEHGNDLEAPARALQPVIGAVLEALTASPGCLCARMSGSGPTCFGIFATPEDATRAAATLAQAHPSWWVREAQHHAAR